MQKKRRSETRTTAQLSVLKKRDAQASLASFSDSAPPVPSVVAGLDGHDFAHLAELLDPFHEDDLHGGVLPGLADEIRQGLSGSPQ